MMNAVTAITQVMRVCLLLKKTRVRMYSATKNLKPNWNKGRGEVSYPEAHRFRKLCVCLSVCQSVCLCHSRKLVHKVWPWRAATKFGRAIYHERFVGKTDFFRVVMHRRRSPYAILTYSCRSLYNIRQPRQLVQHLYSVVMIFQLSTTFIGYEFITLRAKLRRSVL